MTHLTGGGVDTYSLHLWNGSITHLFSGRESHRLSSLSKGGHQVTGKVTMTHLVQKGHNDLPFFKEGVTMTHLAEEGVDTCSLHSGNETITHLPH